MGQTIKNILLKSGAFREDTVLHSTHETVNVSLPVTVIKGKGKGPVFTIIAGIHGYEYPPIIAVQALLKDIDPGSLNGTLILVPVANTAAFYGRTPFVTPVDGKNLNNAFPGTAMGTHTEQLAYLITKEITANSDFFLDIHGGDASEDLLPFICYYDRKDTPEQTGMVKQLCEQSGMQYIVSYPYTITATEPAKYAFKHATQQGIPSLSIEAGKLGTVQQENVTLITTAVRNMLAHLGMYTPLNQQPVITKVYLNDQTYIRVPEKGIFYSEVKSGDPVKKGALLGYIVDEFGHNRVDVISPVDGMVLYKVGTPPVNKGETLFCIGSDH